MSDNAAATNAPAITAAQDTPDAWASFLAKLSANPDGLLSMVDDPERSMLNSPTNDQSFHLRRLSYRCKVARKCQ